MRVEGEVYIGLSIGDAKRLLGFLQTFSSSDYHTIEALISVLKARLED